RALPQELFFSPWRHRRGQLSRLKAAVAVPPHVHSFAGSPNRQPLLEGVDPVVTPNEAWLSLDLVTSLLVLSQDPELYGTVREVFLVPAYRCPEVLLLALAAVPAGAGPKLRADLLSRLLPLYFRPNRNGHAAALIRRLWQVNPRLVAQSCAEAFKVDPSLQSTVYLLRVSRLLPDARSTLLAWEDAAFAVALAAAIAGAEPIAGTPAAAASGGAGGGGATAAERLDLEAWVTERLQKDDREAFAQRLLAFLQAHAAGARPREATQAAAPGGKEGEVLPTAPLCLEALAAALRALQGPAAEALQQAAPSLRAAVSHVADAAKRAHPQLAAMTGGPAEDIEEMANAYFQRIYTSEQSIGEVIEMLQRFKASSSVREQEIFACMVHNLFDEYRFFHKYPEK
ncbi:unnamed protein product, partial [Phaeothamnion confervicola]